MEERPLKVPPPLLFALDRFEQGLEVALAEAARAVALDDLEEHGRAVADRLGEDLEQVALVVAVDQDPEALQVVERPPRSRRSGPGPPRSTTPGSARNSTPRSRRSATVPTMSRVATRDVLGAGAAVVLEVLLDLRLALALGGLVDRELDAPAAVGRRPSTSAPSTRSRSPRPRSGSSRSSRRRARSSGPTPPCGRARRCRRCGRWPSAACHRGAWERAARLEAGQEGAVGSRRARRTGGGCRRRSR